MKKALSRRLRKNAFTRGVGMLVGGTAGAQVLTILVAPLMTRLCTRIGIGGRMDTVQCAIVLAKLDRFDQEIARRETVARRYHELLATDTHGSTRIDEEPIRVHPWPASIFVHPWPLLSPGPSHIAPASSPKTPCRSTRAKPYSASSKQPASPPPCTTRYP